VGVCLTLLGLVLHLDGGHGNALSLLSRGWAEIDRDRQPLLALRGGLALASCLAEVGQAERAHSVLGEAWRLYSRVSNPAEMLRVYWAEARALARMGKHDEALPVLEAVWRQLVAEPSPTEAVLVTADLVLALAQVDRRQEIVARLAALESAFPANPALALGAETMRVLARLALEGEPKLRQGVNGTVVTLRRAFRAWGLWIKPLPVA
jgi:hypothetical protein